MLLVGGGGSLLVFLDHNLLRANSPFEAGAPPSNTVILVPRFQKLHTNVWENSTFPPEISQKKMCRIILSRSFAPPVATVVATVYIWTSAVPPNRSSDHLLAMLHCW